MGVSINDTNNDGLTVLHIAIKNGFINIVKKWWDHAQPLLI